MNLYRIGKTIISVIFYPLYRIKVIGRENIPENGPAIFCSNHISNLDPPVVGITATRDIHFMAKEELFEKPLLGKLLSEVNVFPVKRGISDRKALRKGLKILKKGHTLGLFPEGTRSKTGELGEPFAGAGFFALRSDAPIIPCAIIGPYKPGKKLTVIYGKPIDMTNLRDEKATAKEAAEAIMAEIQKIKDQHHDKNGTLDKHKKI